MKTREILHNGYVFDFENKELFKDGVNFYLTRRESQIIEFFLLNKGKVISKDELINSVW
ncbi:hypothetical protein HOG21_03860 [bacterium]|nr:hypothetical protein [bacterium]